MTEKLNTHHILLLHGPNLNLLGDREPDIYGVENLDFINRQMVQLGNDLNMEVCSYQSNIEGELINILQEARNWANGVIFNPAGYTHTSIALRDTISAIRIPVIEVHLSNIHTREEFRRNSIIAPVCVGSIVGFGWRSYLLGLIAISDVIKTMAGPR